MIEKNKLDYQVEVFNLVKKYAYDDINKFYEEFNKLNMLVLKNLGYIDKAVEDLLVHCK